MKYHSKEHFRWALKKTGIAMAIVLTGALIGLLLGLAF